MSFEAEDALEKAARRGNLAEARAVFDKYPNVNVNDADGNSQTPLFHAAEKGSMEVVMFLIGRGAFVSKVNKHNVSPMMVAAANGHARIAAELCWRGANDQRDAQNAWGETAVFAAAQGGHAHVITEFMPYFVDVDCPDDNGQTPLIAAAKNRHIQAAGVLIEACAMVNVQDKKGYTALMHAVENRDEGMTRLLLAEHPKLDLKNNVEKTVLDIAPHGSEIRKLLESEKQFQAKIAAARGYPSCRPHP